MKLINILLSAISAIVVLLAIVFEGKLKKVRGEKSNLQTFWQEIRLISLFGWILIALMLALNFFNSAISYQESIRQEDQFIEDTIRYSKIIHQLEAQRITDSITINSLRDYVKNNGLKSDSIKLEVVNNAVRALEEERMLLERKKENTFIQMVNEVNDNLRKIYVKYPESHIRGFADTTTFISTRLNNKHLKEYIDMSSRYVIIDYLMEVSESIDAVNSYAENVLRSEARSELRRMNINMFLSNVEHTETYLLSIFRRTLGLTTYKQYEETDFGRAEPAISDSVIRNSLILEYGLKTGAIQLLSE